MSYPGSTSIILNTTGPVVNLNSPAGILSPDSSPDLESAQPQLLNSDYAQWVTYSGWSTADPTETVTFTAIGDMPVNRLVYANRQRPGDDAIPVGVGEPS